MNAVYSLVFAALLITLGRIGDLRGRRLLFLVGMLVFMLSSVVAGLSVNGPMLIGARRHGTRYRTDGRLIASPVPVSSLERLSGRWTPQLTRRLSDAGSLRLRHRWDDDEDRSQPDLTDPSTALGIGLLALALLLRVD